MSLNLNREPEGVVKRYPHEPQWAEGGAVLTNGATKDIPEPKGYLDKLTYYQRGVIARGRLLFRAGGIRFIGGKTWSESTRREGLDMDKRKTPDDDRKNKRVRGWDGAELDDLDRRPIDTVTPLFTEGRFGSNPTVVEGVLINQSPKPRTLRALIATRG